MIVLFDRRRPCLFFVELTLAIGLLASAGPAAAQTVLVRNGATVQVQNGAVLDLEGGTMDFGPAGATAMLDEQSAGRVTGGILTATRALSSPTSSDPAGLGAVLDASVDLGEVTVTRGHAAQIGSGESSIERYYDLTPSQNNSGLSAKLTFTYNDAELGTLSGSESELELFKSTDVGSTWSEEGFDRRDASANTVTLSGIESFSRWTLGSESNPLPVELATFEGTRTEEGVQLRWRTASETGNAGFAVQRAGGSDSPSEQMGADWQRVGFVDGTGTTTEPQTYRYTDEELPYAADTLAYRLRQVDTDGSAEVTDPVTVDRTQVQRLELRETYPNPAQHRVTVRFAVPDASGAEGAEAQIRLYDVLGREVRSVAAEREAGRHELQLSVQDLSSGVYFLRLEAGGQVETRKLTVVQ